MRNDKKVTDSIKKNKRKNKIWKDGERREKRYEKMEREERIWKDGGRRGKKYGKMERRRVKKCVIEGEERRNLENGEKKYRKWREERKI